MLRAESWHLYLGPVLYARIYMELQPCKLESIWSSSLASWDLYGAQEFGPPSLFRMLIKKICLKDSEKVAVTAALAVMAVLAWWVHTIGCHCHPPWRKDEILWSWPNKFRSYKKVQLDMSNFSFYISSYIKIKEHMLYSSRWTSSRCLPPGGDGYSPLVTLSLYSTTVLKTSVGVNLPTAAGVFFSHLSHYQVNLKLLVMSIPAFHLVREKVTVKKKLWFRNQPTC